MTNFKKLCLFLPFFSISVASAQPEQHELELSELHPVMDDLYTMDDAYPHRHIGVRESGKTGKVSSVESDKHVLFVEPIIQLKRYDKYPWTTKTIRGNEWVGITLILHTAEQVTLAKEAALSHFKQNSGVAADDIVMKFWPTKSIRLTITDQSDPRSAPLLSFVEHNVGSKDSTSSVTIYTLKPDDAVMDALEKLYETDLLKAHVDIIFTGVKEAHAAQKLAFSSTELADLETAIDQAVEKANYGDTQYIYGKTKTDISTEILKAASAVVAANDPDLIQYLPDPESSFFSQLPQESNVEIDYSSKDDPVVKSLAKYFEPLINEKKNVRKDQTTNKVTVTLASKEQKIQFENTHDVTLEETETKQTYAPSHLTFINGKSIDYQYIQKQFASVSVQLGKMRDYVNLDTFNLAKAVVDYTPPSFNAPKRYHVPIGTVMCSLQNTKEPPEGFVWLDGQSKWPNQVWVAPQAGTMIPNGTDAVLIGSPREKLGIRIEKKETTLTSTPNYITNNGGNVMGNVYFHYRWRSNGDDPQTVVFQERDERYQRVPEDITKALYIHSNKITNIDRASSIIPTTYFSKNSNIGIGYPVPLKDTQYTLNNPISTPPSIGCRWMVRMDMESGQ